MLRTAFTASAAPHAITPPPTATLMPSAKRSAKISRQSLRRARRMLTPWQQRRHARALARRWPRRWPRGTRRIAVYLASDGELDPAPLRRRLERAGKRVYFPHWHRNGRLAFTSGIARRRRSGVVQARGRAISTRRLGLVLMPLVGFDARGRRLGRGGGVYDRAFGFRGTARRPLLIGLAHELQRLADIEPNRWDVPLDWVATERARAPKLLQRRKSR